MTGNHPIWSIDRKGWIDASALVVGEQVKTQDGFVRLQSKAKHEGAHTVYNLEVYRDHNFLVSNVGILVHNGCVPVPDIKASSINNLKYKSNPKHTPGPGNGYKSDAGIEPIDSFALFEQSVKTSKPDVRLTMDRYGHIHRFNESNDVLALDGKFF